MQTKQNKTTPRVLKKFSSRILSRLYPFTYTYTYANIYPHHIPSLRYIRNTCKSKFLQFRSHNTCNTIPVSLYYYPNNQDPIVLPPLRSPKLSQGIYIACTFYNFTIIIIWKNTKPFPVPPVLSWMISVPASLHKISTISQYSNNIDFNYLIFSLYEKLSSTSRACHRQRLSVWIHSSHKYHLSYRIQKRQRISQGIPNSQPENLTA